MARRNPFGYFGPYQVGGIGPQPMNVGDNAVKIDIDTPENTGGPLYGFGRASSGGGFSPLLGGSSASVAKPNSSDRYNVLRKSKNPMLEALSNSNINRATAAGNANDSDLNSYIGQLGNMRSGNNANTAQEVGSVGDVFNGNLAGSLAATNQRYKDAVSKTNVDAAGNLKGLRDQQQSSGNALIDKLHDDLDQQLGAYDTRTSGEISAEDAARLGLRNQYAHAARGATDLAIAKADRANKAAQAQAAGGGSSYFARLGMGTRNEAETNLANQLAQRSLEDYTATRGQRAHLTDTLANLRRSDTQDIYGQRSSLNNLLAARAREDYGHTLGVDERLNDTLANNERSDIGYVRGQQNSLLGQRRNLANANASDLLLPITARNQSNESNARLASILGSNDLQNNFYGLDDGREDTPLFFGAQNYGRGRGYAPNFGSSVHDFMGGGSPAGGGGAPGDGLLPWQRAQRDKLKAAYGGQYGFRPGLNVGTGAGYAGGGEAGYSTNGFDYRDLDPSDPMNMEYLNSIYE